MNGRTQVCCVEWVRSTGHAGREREGERMHSTGAALHLATVLRSDAGVASRLMLMLERLCFMCERTK